MNSYPSPDYHIDLRNYGPPRTSGIHLSSIIRHIALLTGELKKEYSEGPSLQDLISRNLSPNFCGPIVRATVGFAWESWLSSHLSRVHNLNHQSGELICDGIVMSPDGLDDDLVLHEFKATWKSSAHPVTDQLMWMWQVMGYLYGLSMDTGQRCLVCVLHPLYMCGDYRGERDPVYKPTVIEFEWEELERNWSMMMQYKDAVMPEVH